ncbi:MAG: class I SAM-dependent methyltransferase, partial [Phycisphaerae bacterium]
MKDWKEFFEVYPTGARADHPYKQVGKSVNGRPISRAQFRAVISDVERLLGLNRDDVVLDLCCGNGVITSELAVRCRRVVGVDFSNVLMEQARRTNTRSNIEYVEMDVQELSSKTLKHAESFDKILMYDALAYFTDHEFGRILRGIMSMCKPDCTILLGCVPDKARKWMFFTTLRQRID